MSVERIALDRFFTLYGEALAGFDAEASAALWGEPGTILTDSFAGSLANRKEITEALTQSNETYRKLVEIFQTNEAVQKGLLESSGDTAVPLQTPVKDLVASLAKVQKDAEAKK